MIQTILYQREQSLAYAEYGNPAGFPILIQHGLIASIRDGALFARLAGFGARLICTARPGYGESSPYAMKDMAAWGDVVATLVDGLGLTQFDVLGMSSGAPYSYAIARRFTEQVRNVYIFSGIPALYDAEIQALWPHPITQDASIAEMKQVAHDLFFAHLSEEARASHDVRDSMRNEGFGLAQDFRLRCMDWGFTLADVKANVLMQHSRHDPAVPFAAAELTSRRLPHCRLIVKENDVHFSEEALDGFFTDILAAYSFE